MNKSRHLPSKAANMGQPTRRGFLAGMVAAALWPHRAAAAAPLPVATSSAALGAIAAAVGGPEVRVTVDRTLDVGQIRVGDTLVDAARGLLLKGEGGARGRFLDDGRNAARVGTNVRDALRVALPEADKSISERHKEWSRGFMRHVLKLELALKKSPLRGQALADPHGRRYLLEWAGARVGAKGSPGPAALAALPADAAQPRGEAYTAYLDTLVQAVR